MQVFGPDSDRVPDWVVGDNYKPTSDITKCKIKHWGFRKRLLKKGKSCPERRSHLYPASRPKIASMFILPFFYVLSGEKTAISMWKLFQCMKSVKISNSKFSTFLTSNSVLFVNWATLRAAFQASISRFCSRFIRAVIFLLSIIPTKSFLHIC